MSGVKRSLATSPRAVPAPPMLWFWLRLREIESPDVIIHSEIQISRTELPFAPESIIRIASRRIYGGNERNKAGISVEETQRLLRKS